MKPISTFSVMLVASTMLLGLAGCATDHEDMNRRVTTTTTTTTTGPNATAQAGDVDDLTLANNVRATLASTPGVDAHYINVDADDGVVTLSGDVPSSAMATAAISATQSVVGVRSVHSDLNINNPPR
jgi:osmotically-inducible protein OsmY